MIAPPFTWFDLHEDHGVLELAEHISPPGLALELHVARDPETGRTLAWWMSDTGEWLGAVVPGEA